MLRIRLAPRWDSPAVLAVPVGEDPSGSDALTGLLGDLPVVPGRLREAAAAFLTDVKHRGGAGTVQVLPRPGETTRRLLLVGTGAGDEAGWRAAGAALSRAARQDERLSVALGADTSPEALRGLVEGLQLAHYRFRGTAAAPDDRRTLRQVTVLVAEPDRLADALRAAEVTAELTTLARDLTNTPSGEKTPAWFVRRVSRAAARHAGLAVRAWEPGDLRAEGFHGILAVGSGSTRTPRLLELSWQPAAARPPHVVLVGKGITFDTGGIDLKPRDAMKLMRKDMGGAAAVVAATLGAAALDLPVRITTLTPLAENMVSGAAYRPGDVVRHFGGRTSEIYNTDAEGRLVLADALAYAADRLRPDVLVDLATLTGANLVALGKRTAALYSESDELAEQLGEAARAAGENVWRMPLAEDYLAELASDVADLRNIAVGGAAGSITAALFLREFTGTARDRWVHLDMSAPSWADSADGELTKGATGWGVRTLLRWFTTLADHHAAAVSPSRVSQPSPIRDR